MKVVIASDIHGSEYYMKKLYECFNKEEAEQPRNVLTTKANNSK